MKTINKIGVYHLIAIAIIFVLIIIISLGIYVYVINNKIQASQEISIEEVSVNLQISDLKLCNNVDENFNCDENEDSVFKLGDRIFTLFDVNVQSYDVDNSLKIGFSENRLVIDPKEEIITNLEQEDIVVVERTVDKEGFYSIPVINELISDQTDLEGTYTIVISIQDKFSEQTAIELVTFKIGDFNKWKRKY